MEEQRSSKEQAKKLPKLAKTQIRPAKSQEACVICLEPVSERAIAFPCNHTSFDFLCLVSWLQDHPTCPLCKTELSAVHYDWRSPEDYLTYSVKRPELSTGAVEIYPRPTPRFGQPGPAGTRRCHPLRRRAFLGRQAPNFDPDAAISRRRYVYRRQLYSLHVGSNRLSRFTDITPHLFNTHPELQSKARKWIRRELQVFDFLSSDSSQARPSHKSWPRANNAEFLLEYIIALLKTVDIRGSNGNAEEKLSEFLNVQSARLFLHELGAWLRSPYSRLEDWDRAVQYKDKMTQFANDGDDTHGQDNLRDVPSLLTARSHRDAENGDNSRNSKG